MIPSLQHHLVKCRRNHPDANVVVCPFNSCHHIHLQEKEDHIRTCQDRKFVEMTKYQLGLGDKKKIPFKPDRQKVEDDDEEDWEKKAIIKTSYNPRKKAIQLPVLRTLEGVTPCQRREFRAQEKVRLNDLESGGMGRMMPAGLRKPQLDHGEVQDSSVGIQERRRGERIGVEGGRRNRLVAVGRGAGGQARGDLTICLLMLELVVEGWESARWGRGEEELAGEDKSIAS